MNESEIDRLRECRALGTLAGMTSAGVAFGAYFMGEIFDVTQQIPLFEIGIFGGALVIGMFLTFLGAGGLLGRWVGEKIIFPVRVGDDRTATRTMVILVGAGILLVIALSGILVLLQS